MSRARTGRPRPRAELEESRDFLLRSLSDLDREHEAGDLDDADYARLRADYTARAATVLRSIEAAEEPADHLDLSPDRAGPDADGDAVSHERSGGRRARRAVAAALGLGFIAIAVALVVVSATGRSGGPSGSAGASIDPVTEAQYLAGARADANQGDELGAVRLYQRVLAGDSRQPEALAYEGWALRQAGEATGDRRLVAQGKNHVESAVAASPQYPDAHAFLGYILLQDDHDVPGAVAQFRSFLADHPPAEMVSLTATVVAEAFAAVHQPVPPASSPGS